MQVAKQRKKQNSPKKPHEKSPNSRSMFNPETSRFLESFGTQFPMAGPPVLAGLRRFHGMPVIITAGGHTLGVLTAQLALLAAAALAARLSMQVFTLGIHWETLGWVLSIIMISSVIDDRLIISSSWDIVVWWGYHWAFVILGTSNDLYLGWLTLHFERQNIKHDGHCSSGCMSVSMLCIAMSSYVMASCVMSSYVISGHAMQCNTMKWNVMSCTAMILNAHTLVSIWIYVYLYVSICIGVCIGMCIRTGTGICICVHLYVYVCVYMCTCIDRRKFGS